MGFSELTKLRFSEWQKRRGFEPDTGNWKDRKDLAAAKLPVEQVAPKPPPVATRTDTERESAKEYQRRRAAAMTPEQLAVRRARKLVNTNAYRARKKAAKEANAKQGEA